MSPPNAPLRILLLDDNWDAANELARLLRTDGFDVRTCHTVEQVVAHAQAFQPQVVILDIWLANSSGYDAARRIRKEQWGEQMTLIALTGWGHDTARRQSAEAGFDHHLVKPVDLVALRKLLAAADRGAQ